MNNNTVPSAVAITTNLDVLVPLPFEPKPTTYLGRFISKTWDIQEKNGKACRDLVVKVALDEKNELGESVVVERRYNMLPRGRGVSDFKKDMASYLGYRVDKTVDEFPPKLLANQALLQLDGRPVRVAYKAGRGKHASHDRFLPVETEPAAPAAPVVAAVPA